MKKLIPIIILIFAFSISGQVKKPKPSPKPNVSYDKQNKWFLLKGISGELVFFVNPAKISTDGQDSFGWIKEITAKESQNSKTYKLIYINVRCAARLFQSLQKIEFENGKQVLKISYDNGEPEAVESGSTNEKFMEKICEIAKLKRR